ncbi:hypothetical protein [Pseudolysinimonas yzui]|uniref:Uncharacterized protein n=1 Tax=Pseudolysinimonas yzui TaxID=2708254 RepID=A0A8J3GSP2_9MICO|nr:hypothetical protein [Pseudolysinimonas yzui]GHF24273.1 hypothetical protein GCM10011600_26620 [Pseudolysinimonas yzui]
MNPESSDRDEVLRRLLVATVDAGSAPRRRRWQLPVASIGAFALAGALTGGALATTRELSDYGAVVEVDVPAFVFDDAEVLGSPVVFTGRDDAIIDIGSRPDGATALGIALYCLEPGSYEVRFDGTFTMGTECTSTSSGPDSGGGGYQPFEGDGPHQVSVISNSGRYVVWVGWVDRPADPEPSAEYRAAIADGVVTREEYVAGFERYVACLSDVGVELINVDTSTDIFDFSIPGAAVDSGLEHRCYRSEFYEIDMLWQVSREPN